MSMLVNECPVKSFHREANTPMKCFHVLRSFVAWLVILGVLTTGQTIGADSDDSAYKVGDKLQIKYLRRWYDAEVVQEKPWDPTLKVKFVDQEGQEKVRSFRGLGIRPLKVENQSSQASADHAESASDSTQNRNVYRDWTTKDGEKISDSKYFGHDFTNVSFLSDKKRAVRVVQIPFDSLILADQEFLLPVLTEDGFFVNSKRRSKPKTSSRTPPASIPVVSSNAETGAPMRTPPKVPPSSRTAPRSHSFRPPAAFSPPTGQPNYSAEIRLRPTESAPTFLALESILQNPNLTSSEPVQKAREQVASSPPLFLPQSVEPQQSQQDKGFDWRKVRIGKTIRALLFLFAIIAGATKWGMSKIQSRKPTKRRKPSQRPRHNHAPCVND